MSSRPPEREKHDHQASTAGILSGEVTENEYDVSDVYFSVHHKKQRSAGPSPHACGSITAAGSTTTTASGSAPSTPATPGRSSRPGGRRGRTSRSPKRRSRPSNLAEAGAVAPTLTITVRSVAGEKFDRISNYQLGPIPPRLDGGDERLAENVARAGLARRRNSLLRRIPMPCACLESKTTVQRVADVLDAVMDIDPDHLELLVQQAHECDIKQIDDPPEPLPVSRQALRMFWHFRCNLESVEVTPAHG